jgi:hypothetical protein
LTQEGVRQHRSAGDVARNTGQAPVTGPQACGAARACVAMGALPPRPSSLQPKRHQSFRPNRYGEPIIAPAIYAKNIYDPTSLLNNSEVIKFGSRSIPTSIQNSGKSTTSAHTNKRAVTDGSYLIDEIFFEMKKNNRGSLTKIKPAITSNIKQIVESTMGQIP